MAFWVTHGNCQALTGSQQAHVQGKQQQNSFTESMQLFMQGSKAYMKLTC
jgi:hypothetical protein